MHIALWELLWSAHTFSWQKIVPFPRCLQPPKCQSLPAWPGRPTHVRMTRLIWAQSTQSSAIQRSMCEWWNPVPDWPWKRCPTSTEAVIWCQAILVFLPTQWIGGVPAHFTRLSCLTNVMTRKHNSERTCYSFWSLKSTAVFDLE